MSQEKKNPFWSRTIWCNLIALTIAMFTYFKDSELMADNPGLIMAFVTVIGALNILLRFLTSVAVKSPLALIKGE